MNLIKKYYQWRLGKVEKHIKETTEKIRDERDIFEVVNDYVCAGLQDYKFPASVPVEHYKDNDNVERTITILNREVNSLIDKRKNLINKLNK